MAKRRIDPPDTLDAAIRLLAGLQADGWGLLAVEHHVEYGQPGDKTRRIPVSATVTIRLAP